MMIEGPEGPKRTLRGPKQGVHVNGPGRAGPQIRERGLVTSRWMPNGSRWARRGAVSSTIREARERAKRGRTVGRAAREPAKIVESF